MARLKAEVCITVNGEVVPMLTIGEDGHIEYAMPREEIIKYNKLMLENVAKTETLLRRTV